MVIKKQRIFADNDKYLGTLIYYKDAANILCVKLSIGHVNNVTRLLIHQNDGKQSNYQSEGIESMEISYKFGTQDIEIKSNPINKKPYGIFEPTIPGNHLFELSVDTESLGTIKKTLNEDSLILSEKDESRYIGLLFSLSSIEGRPVLSDKYKDQEKNFLRGLGFSMGKHPTDVLWIGVFREQPMNNGFEIRVPISKKNFDTQKARLTPYDNI